MNRYVTRGHSTSLGLTGGMGSLFNAAVLPADRHTMTEMPTTTATSRQSTSESILKRGRRTTSTSNATPAVIAAVSAMCANGKTEGLVAIRFSSFCVACLFLGRLARELRIQGLVDEPSPFQSDPIIGTDQADTLADNIQASCRRLQHDILHGVGLIHHAGDALQDRVVEVVLVQHGVERAVSPVMGQPHSRDVKRLRSFRERLVSRRHEEKFRLRIDVFGNQPGAGHAVHAYLLPGDPFHDANPPLALISRSLTCVPSTE